MAEENSLKRRPDPVKIQILRMLPLEIKESLTKEEVNAIMKRFGLIPLKKS